MRAREDGRAAAHPRVLTIPAAAQHPLLSLQRTAGNRAVAERVAPPPDPVTVQRGNYMPGVTQATTEELIRSVLEEKSLPNLRFLHNRDRQFRDVARADKLTMIKVGVDQRWIDNGDEKIIEDLWKSFGDGVRGVALANLALWKKCHAAGADLQDLEIFNGLAESFAGDVNDIVLQNLAANDVIVAQEWEKLGGVGVGPEAWRPRAEELRRTAKLVKQAREVLFALRKVNVGYRKIEVAEGNAGFLASPHGISSMARDKRKLVEIPALFDPDKPPEQGPRGDDATPMASYDQIKEIHDNLSARVEGYAIDNPTIYLLIKNGDIDKVADDSAMAGVDDVDLARTTALQALDSAHLDIRKTRQRVETPGGIGFEAFDPVHKQLLNGRPGKSGVNWKAPLEGWMAEATLAEVREGKAVKDLLISLGQGALFCLATMAGPGGLATLGLVGGIALTGQQVGEKIVDFQKLQSARGTGTSTALESASQRDVEAAAFELMLTAIFAVIDVYGASKGFLAARAAAAPGLAGALAAKEATTGLRDIGALAAPAQRELVERSIIELGLGPALGTLPPGFTDWALVIDAIPGEMAGAALRNIDLVPPHARLHLMEKAVVSSTWSDLSVRSGIPVHELGAMFSRAEEAAGRRSPLAIGFRPHEPGMTLMPNPAAEILQSVNDIGAEQTLRSYGGWEKIREVVGEHSDAGNLIMAWRDKHLGGEFRKFLETLDGGAVRTGTKGKEFSNDFDWNFLGPNGSHNRDMAMAWLVKRVGLPEDQMQSFMKADLFVDPRRLHRYDALPPALRARAIAEQTKITQEQVYARLLHDADTPAAKARVIFDRDELGIAAATWQKLDPADIKRLEKELDKLEGDIIGADPATQARLATEIPKLQGLINASRKDAYTAGGSGRKIISERDRLPGYREGDNPPEMLQAEWYSAAVDQLPSFQAAVAGVRSAAGSPAKLAKAIRNLAKFEKRIRDFVLGSGVERGTPLFVPFEVVAAQLDELVVASLPLGGSKADLAQRFSRISGEAHELMEALEHWNLDVLVELKKRALSQLGVSELRGPSLEAYQELIATRLALMEANDELRKTFYRMSTAIQLGRPLFGLVSDTAPPPPE